MHIQTRTSVQQRQRPRRPPRETVSTEPGDIQWPPATSWPWHAGQSGQPSPDSDARTNAPRVISAHPSSAIAAAQAASQPRLTRLSCALPLRASDESDRAGPPATHDSWPSKAIVRGRARSCSNHELTSGGRFADVGVLCHERFKLARSLLSSAVRASVTTTAVEISL